MTDNKYGYWPKNEEELINYLHEQEEKSHSYNSVAESLANVTVAMFNYFASKQGMTGFQCGWSGMQFLRMVRGYEGPFGIIDGSKMLYPQYDILSDVQNWIEEWKPEIGKMATEKLQQDNAHTHPNVLEHWKQLAKYSK